MSRGKLGSEPVGLSARPDANAGINGRFAFVMEMQAGMRTQYLNWREIVEQEPGIDPLWVLVTYWQENGLIERLKFVPGSLRAILRSYLEVGRGLKRERFDAVLFNTYNPALVHSRSLADQRAYLMFDVTPIQYNTMTEWYLPGVQKRPTLFDGIKRRRVRSAFKAAAGLFAWSNWAAQSAIADYGVDPGKIHVVPPGVDTARWRPGVKPDDGVTRLLFTGGNFERKGGDLLLRWAKTTSRRNWELHMVTLDEVEAPPGVIIHRNVDSNAPKLVELAQQADIFVLPTRADCFSIASLEAMAAGLPVLISDVGGIADIVQDGRTGYLLRPGDYDSMHDHLDSLFDSPAKRVEMGRNGRDVVCSRFDGREQVLRALRIMAN